MSDATTLERPTARAATFSAREEAAYTLGVQAYLWGVPFVEYGKTVAAALEAGGTAVNAFRKFAALKTARDRFVVTPNNVTLDGYCAFDVSTEPVAVFVPKLSPERWYIVQLGDHFDEIFHNIGGVKGQQPGVYVITGPDFDGPVPGEMTQLRSRTKMGAAALRVFVNGQGDVAAAQEAQGGFQLMPLSAYLAHGLSYRPPPSPPLPAPPEDAPPELRFFETLGHWMQLWLGRSSDSSDSLIAAFHQIGLSVGRGFAWRTLDEPVKRGLARAALAGEQIVDDAWASSGETTNGFRYTLAGGRAGHDLALRAALAKYVLGAQLADQVVYPNCAVDADGRALDGAHRYVLHFEKGQEPAVSVFWNLAMYASDMLFIENEIDRVSLGSTTEGLTPNPDGSLTLYIQKDRPDPDKVSNWLPAPAGPFNVTMRFYGPKTSVLDGSYRLPPVTRTS